jgi:hypothetical protein
MAAVDSLIRDAETRALFHLELLGCFDPSDAFAPYVPEPTVLNDDGDEADDGVYFGDLVTCWSCGGDGNKIACCDDLCHGQDYCMHGDNFACDECDGRGFL